MEKNSYLRRLAYIITELGKPYTEEGSEYVTYVTYDISPLHLQAGGQFELAELRLQNPEAEVGLDYYMATEIEDEDIVIDLLGAPSIGRFKWTLCSDGVVVPGMGPIEGTTAEEVAKWLLNDPLFIQFAFEGIFNKLEEYLDLK